MSNHVLVLVLHMKTYLRFLILRFFGEVHLVILDSWSGLTRWAFLVLGLTQKAHFGSGSKSAWISETGHCNGLFFTYFTAFSL